MILDAFYERGGQKPALNCNREIQGIIMKSVGSITRLAVVLGAFIGAGRVEAVESTAVKAIFANPPRQYSSAPLWVWNDMMTEELVVSTLRDLASQGVKQAFVHPRPGLMTPYLSEKWLSLWKVALEEAKRLDMNLWIYDENSYPSGFAGGFVPEAMPESRGQGLTIQDVNEPKWSEDVIGIYRLDGEKCENVTEKIKTGDTPAGGKYAVAIRKHAGLSPWYGGKFYVDLIHPGVTEMFLEITMDAYQREIGGEFGKRVPGAFTDEPRLQAAGDMAWTADLPEVFEKRWGYSLVDNLPSLVRPVGEWKRVRHNYFQTVLGLFIERWAKPYYGYCQKEGLEFTGHYWEHEWPRCIMVPDNMAMSAWQQRPGIDTLFNQYAEHAGAQFGNIRAVKEISSVANQLGRRRTLCEVYGGSGWDLRFEDMKRIGDWLEVLGINTLDEHLSHVSIRGARKADYPQTFSYHEPWWDAYHVLTGYFTRVTAAMCQGEQVNTVLVLEPTTTAWMYQPDPCGAENLRKIGAEFQSMVTILAKKQVEYDIGCEEVITGNGSVEGAALKVGNRRYTTVVISPMTENLNGKTAELLEQYLGAGGEVLCCGAGPGLADGKVSGQVKGLSEKAGWKQIESGELIKMLAGRSKDGFAIRADEGKEGILLHHRRKLDDGEILFVTNTDIKAAGSGIVESSAKGIEQWDAETGKVSAYPFEKTDSGVRAKFELLPCGSLLLFLSNKSAEAVSSAKTEETKVASAGQMKIRRVSPNVLTLDYLDVNVAGKTIEQGYFYKAAEFAFLRHGIEHNPWDHAVQFKEELISRKFAADSGFEATYRFTIEGDVPKTVYIVIERPDLYTISCNGKAVSAEKGSWWLDKAFGKIDISSAARVGENHVTIRACPFTVYHELAPAYVLGDFTLRATESGFVIVGDAPLKLGPWNEQGHQLYGQSVSYSQTFEVARPGGRYVVRLGKWYGSVAKVVVNGKQAGYVWHQPWECDVTEQIKEGENEIEVIVTGTLKNTLGPHHANPPLGYAGPDSFRKAPNSGPPAGEKYHTVGYGLFEPFEVVRR
jgi:hypothetical protein